MTNKDRIYVAVYARQDAIPSNVSHTSSAISASQVDPVKYTWGIWIEPKGSTGEGTSYYVDDDLAVPFLMYSFEEHYHVEEHSFLPPHMLGRLMIGKEPKMQGRSSKELKSILKRIPLPSEPSSPINDTVSWTRAAVEELQREGFAEKFDVNQFMTDALRHAVQWEKDAKKVPEKVNYTWSRTFP